MNFNREYFINEIKLLFKTRSIVTKVKITNGSLLALVAVKIFLSAPTNHVRTGELNEKPFTSESSVRGKNIRLWCWENCTVFNYNASISELKCNRFHARAIWLGVFIYLWLLIIKDETRGKWSSAKIFRRSFQPIHQKLWIPYDSARALFLLVYIRACDMMPI